MFDNLYNQVDDTYFRPAVLYNENTKKFVMWLNRIPASQRSSFIKAYPIGTFMVAVADDPRGPFTVTQKQPDAVWQGEINIFCHVSSKTIIF